MSGYQPSAAICSASAREPDPSSSHVIRSRSACTGQPYEVSPKTPSPRRSEDLRGLDVTTLSHGWTPVKRMPTFALSFSRRVLRRRLAAADPGLSRAAVSHEDSSSRRRTATGSRPSARLPDEGATTGVVILPDVRGLYRFYEELALRFAERGYAAVAFDYFGRTAGVAKRDDDFDYRSTSGRQPRDPGGPARPSMAARAGLHDRLQRRLLHGRPHSWLPRPAATGSRERSASTGAREKAPTARPGRSSGRGDGRTDPRAPGG